MDLSEALGTAALVTVLALTSALVIGPSIWGLIDVSRTPGQAWADSGRNKTPWIIAFVLGIWLWFIGIPAALIYAKKVRPELRQNTPLDPAAVERRESSNRILLVVGSVIAALSILGIWAYVTHGHDELFDPSLIAAANSACRDTQAERQALPDLPASPTFEERAQSVERTIAVYQELVTRLRALAEPGENATYDEWIDQWNRYIRVGPAYADAIRTGDPAEYEPAGNAGDEPATRINRVARANGMEACVL